MEDRQIMDFYEAQRHIQSAIMGDTPVKTVQNRQYIDNVSDYDSEHHRILKSACHRLDLGLISLPGAQQHTTVEAAAVLKIQDKIEGNLKAHMQSDNGPYRNEIYKSAESMIPQLDGTYNVSDSSKTDSHDYLDLASTNIIQYRKRGQKQRHEENEMAYANRCSAHIEYIKPNTKVKIQRQKVPDDEDIDIAKIVEDDKPRHDRKIATETERQLKEKEAKRLVLEKAQRLKREKDMKEKEAKRLALEKAQIEALIQKYRPRTLKTPDKVNTLGTGKNDDIDGQRAHKEENPHTKRQQRLAKSKHPKTRVTKPIKAIWIHC